MHTKKIRSLLCLILTGLMLFLSACGSDSGDSEEAGSDEVLLPISINGKEIRVGETTVQTLLDEGLEVSWVDDDYNRVVVDPNELLEANSYYTGGNIDVADGVFFNVSLATEEEDVPLGQAVIARLELNILGDVDKSILETISFDGTPITEWTQEMAVEKYPDWTGNEVMWLHYGLDYKYDLDFDMSTGNLNKFSVECTYDVDWNS